MTTFKPKKGEAPLLTTESPKQDCRKFGSKFGETMSSFHSGVECMGLLMSNGSIIFLWKAPSKEVVKDIIEKSLGEESPYEIETEAVVNQIPSGYFHTF